MCKELEDHAVWEQRERVRNLNKERSSLEKIINSLTTLEQSLNDSRALLELVEQEQDTETLAALGDDVQRICEQVEALEFQRMFGGEMDANNAYLDINAGSGGTEAQDWAEMLLRMYLRWAERQSFRAGITAISPGEVAGIKSATVYIQGDYAYGWLRSETGIHRLVRKSPFNAGNKRHTSFASAFVYPEVDDELDIEINPADLRIDVYRASGAGGQHVNKTESAVRITHLPTSTVVQCQSDRSQHKNKSVAMKQLKAKLYELEMRKKLNEKQAMEESKSDIGWGNQIRSYVLDQSRIKDLRTRYENTNTQAVLDGDITAFIEESLKQGY